MPHHAANVMHHIREQAQHYFLKPVADKNEISDNRKKATGDVDNFYGEDPKTGKAKAWVREEKPAATSKPRGSQGSQDGGNRKQFVTPVPGSESIAEARLLSAAKAQQKLQEEKHKSTGHDSLYRYGAKEA